MLTTGYLPSGKDVVEQFKLEQEMLDSGLERLLNKEGKESKAGMISASHRALIRRIMAPIAEALEEAIRKAASGAPGRRHAALPHIAQVGTEAAAYLALAATLGGLAKADGGTCSFVSLAIRVGRAIEAELWMRKFKRENPEAFLITMGEVDEYRDPKVRDMVARIMARKAGVRPEVEWKEADRALVGSYLLETIRTQTGIIEFPIVRTGRTTTRYVALTTDTKERIQEVQEVLGAMSPNLLPTIIPPKPWSGVKNGGYHSGLFRRLRLIKTWSDELLEELENMDLSEVLSAVNAVQATPWRINERVLNVLEEALASERAIGKLPARVEEIPPFPEHLKHDEAAVKAWKRAAAKIHARNRKNIGKRLQVARVAAIARRFVGRPIWFPHQMDFRGRLYALPVGLNPQGADYSKALLLFDRAYPIEDAVAAGWLMISGANRYGVDKASLEARIEWVEKHEEAILATAQDPWGPAYDFWTKADEPWQFLAWCFEYADFKAHGYGFPSRLPVCLDGSCNGLQHYSAAFRDPEGGRAVNLIGGDAPADIYGIVAERTLEKVRSFLQPGGPDRNVVRDLARVRKVWAKAGIDERDMARRWLEFGIDRKITKRSVMTLPYGATEFASRGFIEDAIQERLEKGALNPFYGGDNPVEATRALFRASLWLQPLVWAAIGETVRAARMGMDWLQKCARVVCAQGLPVTWRTPDGFLVQQAYREWESVRVRTILHGHVFKMLVAHQGLQVDGRAQAQGIAPNWVHSMDACALRMFVNLAVKHGIRDFALVHDSYGVPAAHVDLMLQCLKASFYSLYSDHDPVADFYADLRAQLDDEKAKQALPPPPPKGDLDLRCVLASDYFFA